MTPKRKALHYAMIACGLIWLSAVLWLITSNVIVREIRPIGAIAGFLDKLPEPVSTPIFLFLWFGFLMGWLVLLVWGAKSMIRRGSK